jgi:hypothetical protein
MITTTVASGKSSSRNQADGRLNGVFSHQVRLPAARAAPPNRSWVNSRRIAISSARRESTGPPPAGSASPRRVHASARRVAQRRHRLIELIPGQRYRAAAARPLIGTS